MRKDFKKAIEKDCFFVYDENENYVKLSEEALADIRDRLLSGEIIANRISRSVAYKGWVRVYLDESTLAKFKGETNETRH